MTLSDPGRPTTWRGHTLLSPPGVLAGLPPGTPRSKFIVFKVTHFYCVAELALLGVGLGWAGLWGCARGQQICSGWAGLGANGAGPVMADAASRRAWSSALSSPFASGGHLVPQWSLSHCLTPPHKLGCESGFSFPPARIAFP